MYYDDMMIITGEDAGQFNHRHDFYEKIEAPKFVDFTSPECCHPDHDDRYWFCMRVGCDRKHEEEIDPKEIDKNFVLRVMAARSPSVRFRRALDRKTLSTNMKCPQTAPPKSSIPRESRLATISSISRKMAAPARVKGTPLAKLTTTPNVKPNPRPFQSVKKPKPLEFAAPKSNVVAKALVFHSPKKTPRTKPSVELKTPFRKTCSVVSKPLPSDATGKRRVVGEVKTRGFDSGHGEKSSRCESGPREDDECSDMEIDENSRKGSLDVHCKSNNVEESLASARVILEMLSENSIEAFEFNDSRDYEGLDFLGGDGKSEGKCEERRKPSSEEKRIRKGTGGKENASASDDKEKASKVMESIDDKENASTSNYKEKEKEVTDSTDDKENASAPDDKEKGEEVMNITDDKENASSPDDKEEQEEVVKSIDDKENVSSPDDKSKQEDLVESIDDKENASSPDDKEKQEELMESTDDKENVLGENASSLDGKGKYYEAMESTDDKENVSGPNSKEKYDEVMESTDDKENVSFPNDKEKNDEVIEGSDNKKNASSPDGKEKNDEVIESSDNKKNASSPDGKEKYYEAMESSDDKENASFFDSKEKHDEVMESNDDKENVSFPGDKEKRDEVMGSTDDKENSSYPDDKEKHDEVPESDHNKKNASSPDDKEKHDQVKESNGKENASVPDTNANRKKDRLNQKSTKSKILQKHKNSKCIQKAIQVLSKTMKETSGPQVVKYEKPKPTNPKPFRLRTDERQILKEAKMEKKLNLVKEVRTTTRRAKLDVPQEISEKELKRIITRKHRDQDQPRNKQVKDVAKRTKPPLAKQPARPQWVSSIGKEKPSLKVAPCQLSVVDETSRTMLKHKKAPSKKDALPATRPSPPQSPHYKSGLLTT